MGIRYQLPNGKYIYLSLEQALDLDDEALQDLIADDIGFDSEDPWDDSHDGINPMSYDIPQPEDEFISKKEREKIKKDLEDADE